MYSSYSHEKPIFTVLFLKQPLWIENGDAARGMDSEQLFNESLHLKVLVFEGQIRFIILILVLNVHVQGRFIFSLQVWNLYNF